MVCAVIRRHAPTAACISTVKTVYYTMIHSFRDRTTEDLFNGVNSKVARAIPKAMWPVAVRKLDLLNAAHDLRDLRVPPGNRLEGLKGKWAGHYRMRVNDRYRLVFRWTDGNAHDVLITDYHS